MIFILVTVGLVLASIGILVVLYCRYKRSLYGTSLYDSVAMRVFNRSNVRYTRQSDSIDLDSPDNDIIRSPHIIPAHETGIINMGCEDYDFEDLTANMRDEEFDVI